MKKSSKIWLCITGVALVALGVFCIVYPVSTLLSLSWVIGLMFFVAGCSAMAAWARLRRFLPQSGLMFFSALLQLILGCLLLINPAPIAIALPFIFAFWVLFEGVNIAIGSFDYKRVGFSKWWIMFCIGIVAACFGIWGLANPDASVNAIAILVGVGIILNGVGNWVKVAVINKVEKKLTRLGSRFKDAFQEIKDMPYEEVE